MLELHPNCEICDRDLPPGSTDARICSYECTFCRDCVEQVLENVCPNCGGGFVARPVRPASEHRPGTSVVRQPPSARRVHSPYSRVEIAEFAEPLRNVPPELR